MKGLQPSKEKIIMLALVVLATVVSSGLAHPQCLDFYPPFELVADTQPFCDGYQDFGCCTLTQNEAIQQRYMRLKKELSDAASNDCRNFLKDVLCQECSPYAAHVFDAESTHQRTPFPGLCGDYCSSLYSTCPEIIPLITDDVELLVAYNTGETAFCEAVEIGDMDYCYPNILQDTFLNDWVWESQTGWGDGCLCMEEFANGLRNPLLAVHANDDTHRLFIAEQLGIVHVFLRNGSRLNEPFLDIQDDVLTSDRRGDERGFLGLAFHPNFRNNSLLYIYYSTSSSSDSVIRISELQTMSNDSNRVDMTTERVVIEVIQPAGNHNGGQMLFDDQGYLYAFFGDGGGGGDPFGEYGNAQNLGELLGSVIRIDVDQQEDGLEYAIPPDNPFTNYNSSERRHEIYAYGTRNMWRCSMDRGDRETGAGRGRIFCGDVGQSSYEEIDIILKGGNYGWRGKEGFACYDNDMCSSDWLGENEVLPIHAYPHTVGKSVIGGYVYRGCQYPNLNGKYIFGDYVSGRLFELTEDEETGDWRNREICLGDSTECTGSMLSSFPKNILSFGEDEAGEMYLLSTSNARTNAAEGKVFKIVDPRKRGNPEECIGDIKDVDVHGPTTPFMPSTAGSSRCPKRCKADGLTLSNTTYCNAKFVITGTVQKVRHFNNELRLTVRVDNLHKKAFNLPAIRDRISISQFSRSGRCRCPNLEVGQTYFILGGYKSFWQRFILTESSIVQHYTWYHSFLVPQLTAECRALTMQLLNQQFG